MAKLSLNKKLTPPRANETKKKYDKFLQTFGFGLNYGDHGDSSNNLTESILG